ncbi:AaceriABR160Cp [[Ashbya] aceris (nom. inval.)]|nr:AaceriABR160Cp [[Ashbya] aceris (nom. inval.)]
MDHAPSTWTRITHPVYLYETNKLSVGFVALTVLHLGVCFVLLGVSASDYLCPIVVTLTSQRNRPHKGILAAILLAWCNSSPDLFSSLMSWNAANNAAALSVGEVLGACGVIICVVQGAIFMVMKSAWMNLGAAERHSIIVDLLFAMLAVCIIGYVCLMNAVTVLDCVIMLLVYAAYIVSKISTGQRHSPPTIEVSSPANQSDQLPPELVGPYSDMNDSDSQFFISDIDTGIKPSLLTSIDYNSLLKVLETAMPRETADTISLETMATPHAEHRPVTEPNERVDLPREPGITRTAPPMFQPYSDNPELQLLTPQPLRSEDLFKRRMMQLKSNALYIFAPQLANFREKSHVSQVLSVALTPFMLLLRITIPQYSKFAQVAPGGAAISLPRTTIAMAIINSLAAPLWAVMLYMSFAESQAPVTVWLLASFVATAMLAATVLLYARVRRAGKFSLTPDPHTSVADAERTAHTATYLFNGIGVCCSMLWISYLANTLIEIMTLYQRITDVSEAILGLTIFSWGNSVSDLMSNVAMARLYHKLPGDEGTHQDTKFLAISLGACLGGVLLNTMIGVGISGLVTMLPLKKWSITLRDQGVDSKFLVSCVAIVLQIIFLLWLFLTNARFLQSHMKTVGLSMCAWWLAATLLNLVLEVSI